MKKTAYLFALLVLISFVSNAQNDVFDKIADRTCDCISKKDFKKIKKEEVTTEAGLCILSAYSELESEVPKKSRINFKDEKSLEQLGIQVGLKMATKCPDALRIMSGDIDPTASATSGDSNAKMENEISGTIKSAKTDTYQTLTIHDSDGRNTSLLWISYFPGSDKLIEIKENLVGKMVSVKFVSQEIYYPATNTYLTQKVITSISLK